MHRPPPLSATRAHSTSAPRASSLASPQTASSCQASLELIPLPGAFLPQDPTGPLSNQLRSLVLQVLDHLIDLSWPSYLIYNLPPAPTA